MSLKEIDDVATNNTITGSYLDALLKKVIVYIALYFKESVEEQILSQAFKKTLLDFPMLDGTASSKNNIPFIHLENNENAIFKTARLDITLKQDLQTLGNTNGKHLLETINPHKTLKGNDSLLALKVNYYKCGAMAFGLTWHHLVGDMNTLVNFMNAFAKTASNRTFSKPTIITEREKFLLEKAPKLQNIESGYRYLSYIDILKLTHYMAFKNRRRKTIYLYFTESELNNMHKYFSQHSKYKLRLNDVICAHVFCHLAKLSKSRKSRYLSIAVNARGMLGIKKSVVGNMINSANIACEAPFNPIEVSEKIRHTMMNYENNHLDFYANHQFVDSKGGVKKLNRFVPKALDPSNGNMLVSNWNSSGLHMLNFKGVKPFYVIPIGEEPPNWASAIVDGFHNKGLTQIITLPQSIAEKAISANSLAKLHQFKSADDPLDSDIEHLDWLH